MFTLVITVVVVVGSIVGVLVTAGVVADQTATAGALRPSAADGVAAPAAPLGPSVAVATMAAPVPVRVALDVRPRRLRSAFVLMVLTAFLGALLAAGVGVTLVLVSVALQRAAG